MGHPYWPIFDIVVRTPRIELRLANDDELTDLISEGRDITDTPGVFQFDWATRPEPQFTRDFARFHWKTRALWTAEDWQLPFTVFVDGNPVGIQDIYAKDFAVLREVSTGSWLGRRHHSAGIGTEMRAAVLHFAFAGLGAEIARSGAREGNEASLRVSEKLGYRLNGTARSRFGDGQVATEVLLEMNLETWEAQRRQDIEIEGLEQCLDMFIG